MTHEPWLMASVVQVDTPYYRGRMVVEDVEESRDGFTTTYTLTPLDGNPPLMFGMLGTGDELP